MNRIQNESIISLCNEDTAVWQCRKIFMQQQHNGWIEIAPPPMFSQDRTSFISIIPSYQTSMKYYKHIGKQTIDGNLSMMTSGDFVVIEILSWDEIKEKVYFIGTSTEGPGARQLYAVDYNNNIECLTCELKVCNSVAIMHAIFVIVDKCKLCYLFRLREENCVKGMVSSSTVKILTMSILVVARYNLADYI
jgi:hypothetical protein